jgi:integration host factor subunit alpha
VALSRRSNELARLGVRATSQDASVPRSGESMTKSEIVAAVYARVGGFSKKEAADIVELVFETVKETLGRGEKIKISGFGNFVLRDKRQRRGRNPQTGEPLTITERRVLTFKPSQILKSELNPHVSREALALDHDEHDDHDDQDDHDLIDADDRDSGLELAATKAPALVPARAARPASRLVRR